MRLQCRRLALYRIVLPVRMRIHCGMGRFVLSFFASVFFVFIDLFAGIVAACGARSTRAARGVWVGEAGGSEDGRRERDCSEI